MVFSCFSTVKKKKLYMSICRILDLKDTCESVNKIIGVNVLVPVKLFCLIIILYYNKTFL